MEEGGTNAQPSDKSQPKGQASTPRKPVSGAISAEALVKEFVDDDKAAEKKYYLKEVTVEGVVAKVDAKKAPISLVLKGAKDKNGMEITIICGFPFTERSKVAQAKVGETVGVKGKCFGFFGETNSVDINICSLLTQ